MRRVPVEPVAGLSVLHPMPWIFLVADALVASLQGALALDGWAGWPGDQHGLTCPMGCLTSASGLHSCFNRLPVDLNRGSSVTFHVCCASVALRALTPRAAAPPPGAPAQSAFGDSRGPPRPERQTPDYKLISRRFPFNISPEQGASCAQALHAPNQRAWRRIVSRNPY
jgi:hypothetical protein